MRNKLLGLSAPWLIGYLLAVLWLPSHRDTEAAPQPLPYAEQSVMINEIAWGGTAAGSADEWIELYNTTGLTIALAGWRLQAVDGSPDLMLSGAIGPYSYFLIERTDDTTVSDIAADLTCSFGLGLSNAGESLRLLDASGGIIDTVNGDGGPWPNSDEGGAPTYRSLERRTPWSIDLDGNWVSHDGTTSNGLDAHGSPINGTPRAMNASYVPGYTQSPNLAVTKLGPAATHPGEQVRYTIDVRNLGGVTATHTLVTDTLPSVLLVDPTSNPVAPVRVGQQVVWELGDLPPGARHGISLTAIVDDELADGLTIENVVDATTTTTEPITVNNSARWTTAVVTTPANGDEPEILISSVLYRGYQLYDEDEAVELVNIGTTPGVLSGWSLCKQGSGGIDCWPLPDMVIPPATRSWIARNPAAFERSFGHPPDYAAIGWPRLANDGDEVLLRSPAPSYVDALVYGAGSTSVPGWTGPAVQAYYNNLMGETGQILARKRDEQHGLPLPDTDSEADWLQSLTDPATGRRAVYPGWDLDILAHPLRVTESASVLVGVAPDNAFEVVSTTLMKARRAISIEVYSLRHPALIDLLVQKAAEGVQVTVLLEGDPVGVGLETPDWQTQLYACQSIEAAGGACWFMAHEPEDRLYSRYRFMHAKMLIVDDTWVVVGSQNLTQGGLPSDDKENGTLGSRGVVIATNAPSVVAHATRVYTLDCDPEHHHDLVRWNRAYPERYGLPIPELVDLSSVDGISYTVAFREPLLVEGVFDFEFITAPEAALRQSDALLGLIARAGPGDGIYVEQLYEQVAWGESSESAPNLRLEAYVAAARRGAQVRILVNGRNFAGDAPAIAPEGLLTADYVNALARREGIDLKAAVGDPTGEGIHNKMVLVRLQGVGHYSHVGSINGSEAAGKVNREVALQIESTDIYTYLESLFRMDWWLAHPVYLPMIARNYTAPPPPAPHVVISEVAYTGLAAQEWVELYNPTSATVDLTNYKLGDAESVASWEPMFLFPSGTLLAPGEVLVIAVNATDVFNADLEFYDTDATVPDMIPYAGWGHTNYPFSLRNAGDQVVLLDPDDMPVDVVVWGDAVFPDVTPHPGVDVSGASLERYPPHRDTNDCAVDFRERMPPTPGQVPAANPGTVQRR